MTLIFHRFDVPKPSPDPARGVGRTGVEKDIPGMLRRVARRRGGGEWVGVMVGMGEGGRSPFYIQLPINRPMAALLVTVMMMNQASLQIIFCSATKGTKRRGKSDDSEKRASNRQQEKQITLWDLVHSTCGLKIFSDLLTLNLSQEPLPCTPR